MREILFHGKAKETGEWVEGFYAVKGEAYYQPEQHCICVSTLSHDCESSYFTDVEVWPETVGQYIELEDKNGKKVFEGDIVDIAFEIDEPDNWHSQIYYERAVITWNKEYFGWYALFVESKDEISLWEYDDSDIITVIGNIHDNPELMKGGAE